MKTCPNPKCKTTGIPDEAKFCPKCGYSFAVENSTKESHILRVYNALFYLGNKKICIFRNGKDVGNVSKGQFLDVEIIEDCTIGIKLGSATKECSVSYNNPGIIVCQNDLWKGVVITQCHSEGADLALSDAADNASKTKFFLILIWIISAVILGGILFSELWDWLSCL